MPRDKTTGRDAIVRIAAGMAMALLMILVSPTAPASAETGTIGPENLRIRAGMWGTITGYVPGGARVQINGRSTDKDDIPWYYITTSDGQVGWVHGDYMTSNRDGKARVGVQSGHWRYDENDSYPMNDSGTDLPGMNEQQTNLTIALTLARRLSARGYAVDILPARIPAGYKADVVIAIHADAGPPSVRGFFVERPSRSPVRDKEYDLSRRIVKAHLGATGIPYVKRSTENSINYYAFRLVDGMTPIVLIETGCLTNAQDRAVLVGKPGTVADGLAGAIDDFLTGAS